MGHLSVSSEGAESTCHFLGALSTFPDSISLQLILVEGLDRLFSATDQEKDSAQDLVSFCSFDLLSHFSQH